MKITDMAVNLGVDRIYAELGVQFSGASGEWRYARCPLHEDKVESLAVHSVSGGWKCHAGCGQGDIVAFYAAAKGMGRESAYEHMRRLAGDTNNRNVGLQGLAETYHAALLSGQRATLNGWGVSDRVIGEWLVGWSGDAYGNWKDRFTFPVFDLSGDVCNIRYYSPGAEKRKVLPYVDPATKSSPKPSLYGIHRLPLATSVVIVEGEKDALALSSLGYTVVTGTAGADTWKPAWSPLFCDKRVVVCYDDDRAGRIGARKVCLAVSVYAADVRRVNWRHADNLLQFEPDTGLDASDVVSQSPGAMRAVLELALPFVPWAPDDVALAERLPALDPTMQSMIAGISSVWREVRKARDGKTK